MGVHGLWKLLDPSGKPVPLETLENKVLAVDVSIWLHQVVKGFQDSQGNPVPNAHLLGLFHRVCKLLFYKIKPVFVFDGGVPHLKKQTVALRRQQRSKAELEAERVRTQLLKTLVKDAALKRVLGSSIDPDLFLMKHPEENDMYVLPPEKKVQDGNISGLDEESESSEEEYHTHRNWSTADLHAIDVNSSQFKSLPADVRHDILSELKETRKQSSWGRLHDMPKESSDFSTYQMSRLLKRRSVQVSLEDAEREMGGRSLSIGELEELLNEQGVVTNSDAGKRIASDNTTRYLYVKEIGNQILPKSKSESISTSEASSSSQIKEENKNVVKEEDIPVVCDSKADYLQDVLEFIPEEENRDWSSNSGDESCEEGKDQEENLKIAQNFIFENSGLTQEQILAVIQYQNAVENDTHHGTEIHIPIDQPSTSGLNARKFSKDRDPGGPVKVVDQEIEVKENNISKSSKANSDSLVQHCYSEEKSIVKTISINLDESTSSKKLEMIKNHDVEHMSSKLGICPLRIESSVNDSVKPLKVESVLCKTNKENQCNEALNGLDVSNKQSDETRNLQHVDSDTDDSLIEVNDDISVQTSSGSVMSKALEVVIQTNKACSLEEDIFADVFTAKPSANHLLPTQDTTVKLLENVNKDDVVQNKTLEVVKQTSKTCDLEDDIFAHVFATKSSEKALTPTQDKKNVNNDMVKNLPIAESSKSNGVNISVQDSHCSDVNKTKENENHTTKESVIEKEKVESVPNGEIHMNRPVASTSKISTEELKELQTSLEKEQRNLLAVQGREERLAMSITDQMCMEAQELLQLFGVPYIVAPMEAEAQCAFLDLVSLTDGTITDDSDIWLFGGRKVYKNFFNQKKHVMHFKAEDIKHCFSLERQQMILLALLVGSDYTPGLQGIGPVTALEVLASFPSTTENILTGLQQFRDWLNGGMKVGPGRTPLKNKLKNIQFIEGFPNQSVVEAYLKPKVDESMETFSWQFPDLDSLSEFTKRKFKWTKMKADEILLPVMKKLEERQSQRSLDSYFKIIPKLHAAEGKLSKRVKQAIHRIGGAVSSENEDEPNEGRENLQSKRRCIEPKITKPRSSRGRGRGKNQISKEQIQSTALDTSTQMQSTASDTPASTSTNMSKPRSASSTYSGEFIPQRERDKINALKSKLRAIEVFRTSKIDVNKKKQNKIKRRMLKEAKLSESSSDSE